LKDAGGLFLSVQWRTGVPASEFLQCLFLFLLQIEIDMLRLFFTLGVIFCCFAGYGQKTAQ
ncbi:hypothetical protein QUW17_15820, partial [Bacteroides gallinaceum]|uniref:hypothetical protein n=1 Tax=Bacteroides gallinaceum TaxID=1462571 RepID=UPI0025A3E9B6